MVTAITGFDSSIPISLSFGGVGGNMLRRFRPGALKK
jgi:hypothetical protein